nr:hypothetical protein [Acuticoccus sediminis]
MDGIMRPVVHQRSEREAQRVGVACEMDRIGEEGPHRVVRPTIAIQAQGEAPADHDRFRMARHDVRIEGRRIAEPPVEFGDMRPDTPRLRPRRVDCLHPRQGLRSHGEIMLLQPEPGAKAWNE